MHDAALFDSSTLFAYVLAASLLVLAPGPGQALVVARSIEGGSRAGLLTSLGLEIGTLTHTVAAALGLSAILATSATVFSVVKYLGAAYLVVLGLIALHRAGSNDGSATTVVAAAPSGRALVVHAAIIGIFNPKVALFFLAFMPQFVHPERGAVLVQFLALGLILGLLGFCGDALVAVLAGRARRAVTTNARFALWCERLMGAVLVGLGLRLALIERR